MDIHQYSIDNIRAIVAQTVSRANSGHTGSALSAAPMLYSLFSNHLTFNPKDPNFLGRDRLVFSAGHASALYYSLLHIFGYDLSIDDLKDFRKYKSRTPGHPEYLQGKEYHHPPAHERGCGGCGGLRRGS